MARKALIEKANRKPKYSTRSVNRCQRCGRPRGYIRKFDLCRICFRELAHKGQIPGIKSQLVKWKEVGRVNITDPIADMLTRIRNANNANKDVVNMPASKMKINIAEILKEEGYISDYKIVETYPQNTLRIYLKYGENNEKVITGLKRISKPGLRVYAKKDEIPKVLGGLGIAIISTSMGIVSDKTARKNGVGGEVLCYVW